MELLLAVAITVVIAAFVLQGIAMSRQAFQRDAVADHALRADAALMALAGLIEATLPVRMQAQPGSQPIVAFDGDGLVLHFIALGNGFAMPGGLSAVTLRCDRDALVAEVTPVRAGQSIATDEDAATRTVRLLVPVRDLHFRYFGRRQPEGAADWQDDWKDAETLPELVCVAFDDGTASAGREPLVVALRQR